MNMLWVPQWVDDRTLVGVQGHKAPEKFWPFYILRTNNQLTVEETQQANLFWMQVY